MRVGWTSFDFLISVVLQSRKYTKYMEGLALLYWCYGLKKEKNNIVWESNVYEVVVDYGNPLHSPNK